MNKLSIRLAVIIALSTLVVSSAISINPANAQLTNSQRYADGYAKGCNDAKAGGHFYLDSHPTHTGVFMNGYNKGYAACLENWSGTCKSIEWGLLNPCSTYVLPDGRLTQEGNRAKDCISGGGMLSGLGVVAGLPTPMIVGLLQPLSISYGCDGIVNWEVLKVASNARDFLGVMGIG